MFISENRRSILYETLQVAKEVRGYSDFDLHQVCLNFESLRHFCLNEDALFTSAKMERLKTLLPKLVKENHRILLFSQWTRLLDLFEVGLRLGPIRGPIRCVSRRLGTISIENIAYVSLTRGGECGVWMTEYAPRCSAYHIVA